MTVFLPSVFFRPFPVVQYIIAAFEFALANLTCHYITNFAFSQPLIVHCLIKDFCAAILFYGQVQSLGHLSSAP